MAKYIPSTLGRINGKIGNLVLYKRLGTTIARSSPGKRTRKPTANQLIQQKKFSLAMQFMEKTRPVLSGVYPDAKMQMTASGRLAGNLIRNTFADDNGNIRLDCSQIKITDGPLDSIFEPAVSRTESDRLKIEWLQERYLKSDLSAKDEICLFCYNAADALPYARLNVAKRGDGMLDISLPEWIAKSGFHLWLFVVSEKGKDVSASVYLGEWGARI